MRPAFVANFPGVLRQQPDRLSSRDLLSIFMSVLRSSCSVD
jgi:hypothetical protein